MSELLFSVIIPAYNAAKTLRQALDSVIAQTFTHYEAILVDDGSSDNTPQIAADYPTVQYLLKENGGPGSARNAGAKMARGKYLIFLDADDVLFPWTLATYAKALKQYPETSFFGGAIIPFGKFDELYASDNGDKVSFYSHYFAAAGDGIYVGSCMMGVDAKVFNAAGGFDEKHFVAEDHDFTYRIGQQPFFFFICKPVMIGYRISAQSLSRKAIDAFNGLEFIWEQYKKGGYSLNPENEQHFKTIYAQHARANSLALIKEGFRGEARLLYRRTFFTNIRHFRIKYLGGFWLTFLQ